MRSNHTQSHFSLETRVMRESTAIPCFFKGFSRVAYIAYSVETTKKPKNAQNKVDLHAARLREI